jgi:heme-degrading monooxygenase HmoA
MFVVITHHVCKPGQVETSRERIDKNGGAMTSEPGFLYRYRIETANAPDTVSTLTVWNAEADYQAYRAKRNYGPPSSSPYERIDTQSYQVQAEHLAASA